jgi:hypothetical protein
VRANVYHCSNVVHTKPISPARTAALAGRELLLVCAVAAVVAAVTDALVVVIGSDRLFNRSSVDEDDESTIVAILSRAEETSLSEQESTLVVEVRRGI